MVMLVWRFSLLIEFLLSLELLFKLTFFTHLSQIVLNWEASFGELHGVSLALGPGEHSQILANHTLVSIHMAFE